jgi:Spy/CpxP family protein refolding chaperone
MRIDRYVALGLAALLALPLGASVARAEAPGERPPSGGGAPWSPPDARLEQHLRELGLDAAQLEKARGIIADAKRTREEIDARLRKAFEEMRAMLEQDAPDESAVMRQADRIGAIRTEGRKAMLRALLAVRAGLSPEQRQKLNEVMRRDGPHGWRGRLGRGSGAPGGARPPAPPPEPE